jgi:hypothetical protein
MAHLAKHYIMRAKWQRATTTPPYKTYQTDDGTWTVSSTLVSFCYYQSFPLAKDKHISLLLNL